MPSSSWKQLRKKPLVQNLIAWADFKFVLKTLSSVQAFFDMLFSRPHFSQAIGSVGRWQSVLAAEIAFVTLLSMCPVSEDCCSLVSKWNYLSCISLLREIYERELWNCSSPSNSVIILTPECLWFFPLYCRGKRKLASLFAVLTFVYKSSSLRWYKWFRKYPGPQRQMSSQEY